MKKIISSILCISFLASIISISVLATGEPFPAENIDVFCDGINEMITEYGDSEFITPEFIEKEQATEEVDNEEIEINYCPRLIVQSDKAIDTYNAVEVVSGFFNFYILQFENEKDTNHAYEQYKDNPDILSVEYDVSYEAVLETTTDEIEEEIELTYEDYKNGWYLESTGMDTVLEKYQNQNLPEVVVAVVDTGVDLNSKYLKNRLIKTGFNNAGDGDENSEQDYDGHGTMVSSVIANCTTDNVKIANYRCIKEDGRIDSLVLACSAIIQAVNDGAEAINCSFIATGDFDLMSQTINYAYSKKVAIVSGAGNLPNNLGISASTPLNNSIFSITTGANNALNIPTSFTAYGEAIDILAPGENIVVINLNDTITSASGTSFSTPIIASVYAMFCCTHQSISFKERFHNVENCGSGTEQNYVNGYFGSGVVNTLKLFGLNLVQDPVFSLDEGKYVGEISLELYAEDDAEIYYTTDQTYPSPTNGNLYTGPIKILDDELCIRAVAYKNGNRSNYIYKKFYSMVLGSDDMFTINDYGVITGYTGNVKYLKIPEVIKGMTVKELSAFSGFDKAKLYGVILPETVEYLGWTIDNFDRPTTADEQLGAFNDNTTIEFIIGKGIKVIGYYGVSFTSKLKEVDFPNCEEIMCSGFYESGLVGVTFPKVKKVDNEAFYNNARLREIYLPQCKELGYGAFKNNSVLRTVYAPKINYMPSQAFVDNTFTIEDSEATKLMFNKCTHLSSIDMPGIETIGTDFFEHSAIKNVSLSQIKYIYDLPNTLSVKESFYGKYYLPVPVELSLPSTLQYCVPATDHKNEFIEYVVYGTSGINSYAELWAKANDIKFVNISQETAVIEDIEPFWDKYSYKPLEFDARGFNRTYQWYGSNDKVQGNYDDKPIPYATDKSFNPNDYKAYQYYYCKMLSVDGSSEVTITSSMCHNRLYYMFALDDTHIDFDNKLIYTKTNANKDIFNIINIQDNTSYYSLPSYVYKEHYWYGTGSEFIIYNGSQRERYTLIVEGDINGDSAVDVLDAFAVSLTANGLKTIEDEYYFLAADANGDKEITVEDYAQVVNLALSS